MARRWTCALLLLAACASKPTTASVTPGEPERAAPTTPADLPNPGSLGDAEAALAAGEPARAVALFAAYLASEHDPAGARQAYPGLARAHEQLGDFAAAVRAYDEYLSRFAADAPGDLYSARGACHAELAQWQASADDFAAAFARATLPSAQVEALTRQGYALFQLGDFDHADPPLKQADEIFLAAQDARRERFTTFYFVGMARFYRAAIHHRHFREIAIRLPEKVMAEDFARKFAALEQAQDGYNYTVKARHMFWVSAAGYQLGSLFEEFYDAMMYAPVPEWLDEAQRQTYYEELKNQLRPVVNKAIWVFEKNLETARKLGYDSEFVARTEAKLSELQAVLLAGDTSLGRPHPRLAPEARPDWSPGDTSTTADPASPEPSPVDRKLFVPEPTPL
ncbi:MAG: tetratricopeptide repeat protein [Nannocystis sp.]|uniref:tetratricopeptide repeat protein n=1 Tax=Nannocystis sp. TaxID=1962667 RepID=UPI0024224A2D|nr:tetratricopeptide repeat protein [Nannocystis sp.]MBK9754748.1 tetratricopeptide repeat protein [Nannocystis sp.]